VNRAQQTLTGLDWFEVGSIRGQIVDGRIAWYQVAVKVAFRVMSDEELKAL
jgi:flavin-binding protein dodecin